MRAIRFNLLPKQRAFVESPVREALFSGGFGAGKTRALCVKLVARARIKGARELLCRKTNVALKRTTLHTLLRPDGELPPVLPEGSYVHRKTDQVVALRGGGEIVYCGLDTPAKIGSLQLTGAAIDEAVELDEDDYIMLRGRIRVKLPQLPNQIYAATNPGAPSHFLARRFGLAPDTACAKNCVAFRALPRENRFLPPDYLRDLETFTGVSRARFVEGEWVGAEGLVFPTLLDCFVPHETPPEGRLVGGVDFGFRNPFCALLGTVYADERDRRVLYVFWERYARETPIAAHAAAMRRRVPLGDCVWAADPEDPEAMRALKREGLRVVKARKQILAGVDAVNGLLAQERLFVSARCHHLRREAEVYCYGKDERSERPDSPLDHAMDALRYLVMEARARRMFETDD